MLFSPSPSLPLTVQSLWGEPDTYWVHSLCLHSFFKTCVNFILASPLEPFSWSTTMISFTSDSSVSQDGSSVHSGNYIYFSYKWQKRYAPFLKNMLIKVKSPSGLQRGLSQEIFLCAVAGRPWGISQFTMSLQLSSPREWKNHIPDSYCSSLRRGPIGSAQGYLVSSGIHRDTLFFHKLKVCGNSAWSKSIGTIFPSVFAPFVSRGHILILSQYCQLFHYDVLKVTCDHLLFEVTIVIVWGYQKPNPCKTVNLIDKSLCSDCSTNQSFISSSLSLSSDLSIPWDMTV